MQTGPAPWNAAAAAAARPPPAPSGSPPQQGPAATAAAGATAQPAASRQADRPGAAASAVPKKPPPKLPPDCQRSRERAHHYGNQHGPGAECSQRGERLVWATKSSRDASGEEAPQSAAGAARSPAKSAQQAANIQEGFQQRHQGITRIHHTLGAMEDFSEKLDQLHEGAHSVRHSAANLEVAAGQLGHMMSQIGAATMALALSAAQTGPWAPSQPPPSQLAPTESSSGSGAAGSQDGAPNGEPTTLSATASPSTTRGPPPIPQDTFPDSGVTPKF
ncbi:unnamed protein product [Prorocentrum cordatum]|uniref:Uncharacterized protein n=1 Tax=Prorocentrum cordatum TaxID=2364126 RepID=A0ABN9U9L0_9DINO|nr:unnamed protein product [Polarella glacialis]